MDYTDRTVSSSMIDRSNDSVVRPGPYNHDLAAGHGIPDHGSESHFTVILNITISSIDGRVILHYSCSSVGLDDCLSHALVVLVENGLPFCVRLDYVTL